jgi:hypothetical protein
LILHVVVVIGPRCVAAAADSATHASSSEIPTTQNPSGTHITMKVLALFAGIVAILLVPIIRKHWLYRDSLSAADFPRTSFEIVDVPTVFYDNLDNMTEIQSKFILYRSKNPPNNDINALIGEETLRTKTIDKNCNRKSFICYPCFEKNFDLEHVRISTVSSVLLGESGQYASFSKLSGPSSDKVWNIIGANFSTDSIMADHSFISNLPRPMITAQFHANSLTTSMAVQLEGSKTWFFIDRETWVNSWGAEPAAGIGMPTHTPREKTKLYVYTSQPGDILFFPASYAHAVITHAGRNVMVNFRKKDYFESIMSYQNPIYPLTALVNLLADNVWGTLSTGKNYNWLPEKKLNKIAGLKTASVCSPTESSSSGLDLDKQLLEILEFIKF